MKPLLIWYDKCSTCQKAVKWLQINNIEFIKRDIIAHNPSASELAEWMSRSTTPILKFFNTSGVMYKEMGLKDIVKTSSNAELLALLASHGKLVKRPLLITSERVLVGFNESEWDESLIG